jgi:myo-inositol 2-dehydrogenase/D-chiro-inositol 1-dehydrogenase
MSVRVGVIGVGVMGADHARSLATLIPGAVVSAVADIDRARAHQLALELGAQAFADADELIESKSVDAILVASHDSTHAALTIAAVALGKPVLCEKPLALIIEEAASVVDAECAAGTSLVSVGFSRRFDPAIVALRDSVLSGAIGRPLIAHAIHRNVSTSPDGDSASTVMNTAIHEIDEIPWVLDSPIIDVSWHAPASTSLLPSRQDPQLILLRTDDGTLTTLEVFVNALYGYDVRLEVAGERGTLSLADSALLVRNAHLGRTIDYPEDWRPRFAEAYRAELHAWIGSIITGIPSPAMATAIDGYRATVVAAAVIASMNANGSTIPVVYPHESNFSPVPKE